jgi:hypothetical protein
MDRVGWWQFTGTVHQLRRLGNTLRTNRHLQVNDDSHDTLLVMDKKTTLFLSCQFSEKGFVQAVANEHNVRVKETDAPEYGQAPCGKFSTDVVLHGRACKSCQQLRRNLTVAAGGDPPPADPIPAEDVPHNAVSVIEPPCQVRPNDYSFLAEAARETSEKLLTQSTYYSTLAERYDALTQPTDAIRQAQAALKAAQESAEDDRKEQHTALQSLLEEGEPEAD